MKNLIQSVIRTVRRNKKRTERVNRNFTLLNAGRRLLAKRDYEAVSVSEIALEAGISVGAFYGRFRSKDAFLDSLVRDRFSSARRRMEAELDLQRLRQATTPAIVEVIIDQIMQTFHGAGAGVARAALKRAHVDRDNLQPLRDYRSSLSDRAALLLISRVQGVGNPDRAVRTAIQMAEATALDALLHETGALRSGSRRMAETLSAMMLSSLGISVRVRRHSSATQTDEAVVSDENGGEEMLDMPIEDVEVCPVPPVKPIRSPRRASSKEPGHAARISVLATTEKEGTAVEAEEAPVRPKRRRLL